MAPTKLFFQFRQVLKSISPTLQQYVSAIRIVTEIHSQRAKVAKEMFDHSAKLNKYVYPSLGLLKGKVSTLLSHVQCVTRAET